MFRAIYFTFRVQSLLIFAITGILLSVGHAHLGNVAFAFNASKIVVVDTCCFPNIFNVLLSKYLQYTYSCGSLWLFWASLAVHSHVKLGTSDQFERCWIHAWVWRRYVQPTWERTEQWRWFCLYIFFHKGPSSKRVSPRGYANFSADLYLTELLKFKGSASLQASLTLNYPVTVLAPSWTIQIFHRYWLAAILVIPVVLNFWWFWLLFFKQFCEFFPRFCHCFKSTFLNHPV